MATVTGKKPNIEIAADPEGLARQCLKLFAASAHKAIQTKDVFYVAISGGQTPKHFFRLLGDDPIGKSLHWEKVQLFWVDERYVPPDSPWSNYRLAADTFLSKVSIPHENVHRIPTEFCDFNLAVQRYEQTIRRVFRLKKGQLPQFDLVILGMGADGHTGSLFPNSFAPFDSDDIATVVYLLDQKLPDQMLNRITLTHPVLCAAERLAVLVSGAEKAQILKEVLTSGPDDVRFPIHTLWPVLDKVTWIVDSYAAKLL
jgi:6-phosphogluconolactonase